MAAQFEEGRIVKELSTIGYEGAALEDFLETLKLFKVDVLLDVRELPISRRKGFSKKALSEALAEVGISYQHERCLGSPKVMRHELRESWDYERFFLQFNDHLKEQHGKIEELAEELRGHIALLCFERNHTQCHRTPVAEKFSEATGIKPRHIGVQDRAQRQRYKNQSSNSRKSLSTA
ncbi:DUF488 domain-containing protein [Elongatibacter sediminis]|uniref:DUF488 domain-containing protein n=1 Tax=Elongatibacter sediminis TaxID=3119006 RepID=A0AAW9RN86_9GAMM